MRYFEYGEKEAAYLSMRDKRLGDAIAHIGHIGRPVIPDLFYARINSIVGRQTPSSAQQTI